MFSALCLVDDLLLIVCHDKRENTIVYTVYKVACLVCLFVSFVALRPKSTAMVIAGRSIHLTTLFFLGKLEQAVNQYFMHILSHILSLVTDNNPYWMIQRKGE